MLNANMTLSPEDIDKIHDQLDLRKRVAAVVKVNPFCPRCRFPIFKNYPKKTCGTFTYNQCSVCHTKINFIEPQIGEVVA